MASEDFYVHGQSIPFEAWCCNGNHRMKLGRSSLLGSDLRHGKEEEVAFTRNTGPARDAHLFIPTAFWRFPSTGSGQVLNSPLSS